MDFIGSIQLLVTSISELIRTKYLSVNLLRAWLYPFANPTLYKFWIIFTVGKVFLTNSTELSSEALSARYILAILLLSMIICFYFKNSNYLIGKFNRE